VRYVSTRGGAPDLGFADVLLAGLAPDGGLYVPEQWPELPTLHRGMGYASAAAAVVAPFIDDEIDVGTLRRLCDDAYATFAHPAVCPLVQIGPNDWLLELFHGPTLAFKDVALQLVGRLFDDVLSRRQEHLTIVVATSGDTGSAAIDAVAGRANVDIVVLYPQGRVSDVQRRQMTTVDAPNVRTAAIEGTFDDCQDLVKAMFADEPFRREHNLGAVNSINWARVMAQVVYYVTASLHLAPPSHVAFAVPTGNFGNVLSGWVARRMGAPIHRLVIGSNRNDILARFLHSGIMATSLVVPTLSPSMDIQVSSNFERLLFELNHRDGGMTAEQLLAFRATGSLVVEADQLDAVTDVFDAARVDDDETLRIIADTYRRAGILVDPHTAVGLGAAAAGRGEDLDVPMVTLATAHPAKFPDAVEAATGVRPSLPGHLGDLLERPERSVTLPNDLATVEAFVAARGPTYVARGGSGR
jgi:threonine synthase